MPLHPCAASAPLVAQQKHTGISCNLAGPCSLSCCCCCCQVGQTFTIEPIFVEGSNKVTMWKDDWTATTTDGGLAAQCEHTVLITPGGCEVLTVA